MDTGTIALLKQMLDSEEQSDEVTRLPSDTYTSIATYMRKLRRRSETGGDEPTNRLIKKQISIIDSMIKELVRMRLEKALNKSGIKDLLPEEKNLYRLRTEFENRCDKFVTAVSEGRPSFFAVLEKTEMERMVTVRFVREVGEIIGFDLRRYGPFEIHDVAQIPGGNADVLAVNGEAVVISTRDAP